jgi:hypothetical protein
MDSDGASSTAKEVDLVDDDDLVMITAFAVHPEGRFIICGKDDGSVCLYNAQTGLQIRVLYDHGQGAAITHLNYDMKSGLVTSADDSSTVLAYRTVDKAVLDVEGPILRIKLEDPINQLLIQSQRLVIITPHTASLYNIDGQHLKSLARMQKNVTGVDPESHRRPPGVQGPEEVWRWLVDPIHADQIILFDGDIAVTYTMQYLESLTELAFPPYPGTKLDGALVTKLPLKAGEERHTPQTIIPCFDSRWLAMSSPSLDPLQPPSFTIWPTPQANPPTLVPSDAAITRLSGSIALILGSFGSKLIFLDRQNWVSSIELAADHYARHFCIPFDWLGMNELLVRVTQTVVVFVRRNEIAVVRNGFAFAESVPIQ